MAKKRKQRSSEPAAPIETTNQQLQPEPIQEEEPQYQQNATVEDDSGGQPQEVEEEDEEHEEVEQEEVQEEGEGDEEGEEEEEEEEDDDDDDDEEEEDKEKEEHDSETLEPSSATDVTQLDPPKPEANGANEATGNGNRNEGNDEEDYVDDEPLEKLLQPFGKDQLVALLRKAVDKYPDLMDFVREIADADPAHRKIFVHGLGWDTTAETLKSEFGNYGEIEDCKAVTDRVSGKSKGYAFILFKHRAGARKALSQPQKKIGNRITSCQLATAGPVPAPPPTVSSVSEYTQRKIFVSNVSADLDPDKLLQFFRQYGEVEEGPLGLDKQTGKPKGFALFVYRSVEGAKKALEEPHKKFEGHTLHCQKAIDGPKQNKMGYGGVAGHGGAGHHQHQHQHHQQHYHHTAKKGKYSSGAPGPGHLMAPSGPSVSFNPGMASQGLNPAIGQALTALIATQGAGLGLGNLLGGLGGAQGGAPAGYGNQAGGGYGNQPAIQGGYPNPQLNPHMGQTSAGRSQQGSAPYMGH